MTAAAMPSLFKIPRSARLRAHEKGVGRISAALARALGKEPGYCEALAIAGELHDVGKCTISDVLLEKPGQLDAQEWEKVKTHTVRGRNILVEAGDGVPVFAAQVALHHHECWDGSGYPSGLKGESISQEARIVSLSDCYDALREARAYKPPRCHEEVIQMLFGGSAHFAGKFDPDIVAVAASNPDLLRDAHEAGEPN